MYNCTEEMVKTVSWEREDDKINFYLFHAVQNSRSVTHFPYRPSRMSNFIETVLTKCNVYSSEFKL